MGWSYSAERRGLPRVHLVRDRYTVYVAGRRLIAKDASAFGDAKLAAMLRDRDRSKSDGLRSALIAKDVIPESAANGIGRFFSRMVPGRRYIPYFLLWLALALALGISASLEPRSVLYGGRALDGALFQLLSFVVIVCWHEIGHMAAARKFGIRVDSAGIGAYFIIPALFTRVSMLALLPRGERINVMLAGILFQSYLGVALAIIHFWSADPTVLRLIESNILIAFLNLIPFIRLDGHHVAVEVIAMLNEQGRLSGVQRWYDLVNRVFTVVFLAYLVHTWNQSLAAVSDRGSSSDVAYFTFITTVLLILLYRAARTLVSKFLVRRRSAPGMSAGAEA